MNKSHITLVGKAVRMVSRLKGGGGSALPGLVIEKIDASYVPHMLAQFPKGVVVVSGTNGKTTTTKMVVELLESQNLKVFTNKTGSNFVRGVAAALVAEASLSGRVDADIAVLELDEAHAVQFVKTVQPQYSLLLNVMRDQLDRFGEIDATAGMLEKVANATTLTVVANREDPRILKIGQKLRGNVSYYGLTPELRATFINDDDMRSKVDTSSSKTLPDARGILKTLNDNTVGFSLNGNEYEARLQLTGIYNTYNAVAAATLVSVICAEETDYPMLIERLAAITPAFGRGEKLIVNGQPLELVLVKNPGGFRLGLQSFSPVNYATMIAVNDNYADGRDMSWLWDVDFDSLSNGVDTVSGIRAYDMGLRLDYDEIAVRHIETNLEKALADFISTNPDTPKRVYCTYTAMLELRKLLKAYTDMERVL